MTDHVTDDKGNKYQLVQVFDHDMQEYVYVLQPMPIGSDDATS